MKYLNPYLQKETVLDTTILLINFYIFSIFIYAFKKKKNYVSWCLILKCSSFFQSNQYFTLSL